MIGIFPCQDKSPGEKFMSCRQARSSRIAAKRAGTDGADRKQNEAGDDCPVSASARLSAVT
jgi:hypothetical protein